MFSVVSVRQSVILFTGGSHVTINHDAKCWTSPYRDSLALSPPYRDQPRPAEPTPGSDIW